jgi:hypothetical protein
MHTHRTRLQAADLDRLIAHHILPPGARIGAQPPHADAQADAQADRPLTTHGFADTMASLHTHPAETTAADLSAWLSTAPMGLDDNPVPELAHLVHLPPDDGAEAIRQRTTARHFGRLSHDTTPIASKEDVDAMLGRNAKPVLRVVHGSERKARADAEYAAWAAEQRPPLAMRALGRLGDAEYAAWAASLRAPANRAPARPTTPPPRTHTAAHLPGARRATVRQQWEPRPHWLERVPLLWLAAATVAALATIIASTLWPWGFALPL